MEVISGKQIADEIKLRLQDSNLKDGISPCLAAVDVGENPENSMYIGLKETAVQLIGGRVKRVNLSQDSTRAEVLAKLQELNLDQEVDGILLQLPLPPHLEPFREDFLQAIVPGKDVDGFSPYNRGLLMGSEPEFVSCAALACLDICRRFMSPLAGKKVLLVGNSFDVIQPLALLFIKEGCRVTVIPHYYPAAISDIDIAIVEHGSPLEVKAEGIKPGALIIDAGFHWHDNKTCGNVDKNSLANSDGYLLPVPGGMGPLLIAQLMENLSRAAHRK